MLRHRVSRTRCGSALTAPVPQVQVWACTGYKGQVGSGTRSGLVRGEKRIPANQGFLFLAQLFLHPLGELDTFMDNSLRTHPISWTKS